MTRERKRRQNQVPSYRAHFDSLEHRLLLTGTLGLDKTADVASAAHGDTINYSYGVTFAPGGGGGDPTEANGSAIVVSDDKCSPVNPVPSGGFNTGDTDMDGNLDAGETWQYTCAFTVPALHSDGEEDPIVNTATVTGNDINGDPATSANDSASVNITHDTGALSIAKSANVSSVAHGGSITYSFDVTYAPGADGSPAQNIVVADAQCDAPPSFVGGDTDGDGLLDGGETWNYTCSFAVPALHSDGEEDPILNTATASGQDLDGDALADATSNTVSVDIVRELEIVKSADVSSVPHGGTITYTFLVTYEPDANGPAQNVVVTDSVCDAAPAFVGGDTNSNGFLDTGETWDYACSHSVAALHSEGETDPIINTASVSGEDQNGDPVTGSSSNTVSVDVTHDAGTLNISKNANVSSVAHGGTVTYTFEVTYTPGADGSPAQNVVVTDAECDSNPAFSGGDTNANDLLDAGETWTYACTHAVAALHSAGEEDPIENTASVTGEDLDADPVTGGTSNTVSVDIVHAAGTLSVSKSADVSSVPHGGTVTYTFDVTYAPGADGSPAQNIAVSDAGCDAAPAFSGGDTNSNGLLDASETWTYTCAHAVAALHSAGEPDPIVNTATVSGSDLDGDPVTGGTSNTVSVDVTHDAGTLGIVKSSNVSTVEHSGTITYTFDVTYTPGADGSPAQNIVVTDAQCSSAPTFSGGDANSNGLLDSGETWAYTCTFTVPTAHSAGEEDPIENTASVSGQDVDGDPVTGGASNTVSVDVIHPFGVLNIVKSAGSGTVAHGGTIASSFDVTFTPGPSGAPAQNILVTDAKCDSPPAFVGGDTNGDGLLDAGETWNYSCSHAVPALHSAGEENPIVNTANVTGQDFDGNALPPSLSNTVTVNVVHATGTLSIVKTSDVSTVAHGGTVNYTFNVTYAPGADGSPAQNIVVSDAQCNAAPAFSGGDTNGNGLLDSGETWTYTCSFAVSALHSSGEEDPIENSATVASEDLDGDAVTGGTSNAVSVDVLHDPGTLSVAKSADVPSVIHGGTVTYTFNVTYAPGADGSPAQNIVIADARCDAAPAFTGGDTNSDGLLDAGETWTYTCSFGVPALHSNGEEDPIVNTATATGEDVDGAPLVPGTSNAVSVNIVHAAGSLNIAKSADVPSVAHGGTITYTFNVTYTPGADGSPAQNIVVSDANCDAAPAFTGGDANGNGLLDGGETWAYTCTHAVAALHSAGEEDPIVNTATASGQDLDGDAVADGTSNTVSVNVVHAAGSLAIVKSADRTTVAHGGTVTYTFAVAYTPGADGSPAQTIVVADAQCAAPPAFVGGDTNSNGLLDSGETWTYTCSFTAPAAHSAGEEDPIVNSATVAGQDLDGDPVTGGTSNMVSVDLVHATISGSKFLDIDGNGVRTANEPFLAGWTINLFRDANGNGQFDAAIDTLIGTRISDAGGSFNFANLTPGTYFVREVVQANWAQSTPNPAPIAISAGESIAGINFGNRPPSATLIPDPADPTKTALLVVGTNGNDVISFRPGRQPGDVVARLNKRVLGTFHPTGRIIAYGLDGDDRISLSRSISMSAQLVGGAGNDRLAGGRGHDILLGGDGNDDLNGHRGRDILIGGAGADRINGSADDDIIVAGTTDHDLNDAALAAILAEWTSTRDYTTRNTNIRVGLGGNRLNGNFFFNVNTVHDDAIADLLTGSSGQDWYLFRFQGLTRDTITDRKSGEVVDVIS